MKIRILTQEQAQAADARIWEAYIDLISSEQLPDLSDVQRPAALVFRYGSEVRNGGHLQYFTTQGTGHIPDLLAALLSLGAHTHHGILTEASSAYTNQPEPFIAAVEQYCSTTLEDEFVEYDNGFHECSPELDHYLKAYLESNRDHFVLVR